MSSTKGTSVPWERRYFKGDEVWVETDSEGEPVVENGRLFMKYEKEPDAKIYQPHADRVSEDPEADREAWKTELEERERRLDERERSLDAREESLDERERALEKWEESLKQQGIVGGQTDAERSRSGGERPDFLDGLEPPEPGIFEFHTDGACSGNPGPCGYGVVMRHDDEYREWHDFLGRGTNNIAELEAIRAALEAVDDRTAPVRIFSDSRYAIGVLTKGWNAKANTELITEIRELLDEFDDVEIRKVEGHAGDPLNERADDLATDSIPDTRA